MDKARHVVITGLGLVTPAGMSLEENWLKIINGQTALDLITRFDVTNFPVKLGGQISDLDPLAYVTNRRNIRFLRNDVQYCLAAARIAYKDSRIDFSKLEPARIGLFVGSGESQTDYSMFFRSIACARNADGVIDSRTFGSLGLRRIYPSFLLFDLYNNGFCYLSMEYGVTGINNNFSSGVAGGHAIGEAFKAVQSGEIDVALAGGYDSLVSSFETYFLGSAAGLFTHEHDPIKSMKPYSAARDGCVPSEGSGFVMLEELHHARKRSALINGEIVGYYCNCDGNLNYHFHPHAKGLSVAIDLALQDAGIRPSEIGYINSDGNATVCGDAGETRAIKRVFANRAYQIPVSTVKPVVGHLGAAASAIELIITTQVLNNSLIPPSVNCSGGDPNCDLDYVPRAARRQDAQFALCLNRGWGGQNCVFVIKKFSE